MELHTKKCRPCEGGIPKLNPDQIADFNSKLDQVWNVTDEIKISREYSFKSYQEVIEFVNRVAHISESEGHHPVMHVFFSKIIIELWTHSILGLSENDFILAAKIDVIYNALTA